MGNATALTKPTWKSLAAEMRRLRECLEAREHQAREHLVELAAEMRRLRERLEDIEDLVDLRRAIVHNKGKPGVPWERVKAELELD